jgi:CheY-like chemotaxis protein
MTKTGAIMPNKKFYTTGEISKILGISQKTVKNYITAGKIIAENTPITNYSRIPKDNLIKFMQDNGLSPEMLEKGEEKRVLVVDDDPTIIALITRVLQSLPFGLTVESAVNGYEACIKAGVFIPNIIFLDIQMPMADGFEVCKSIRNVEETKGADIVIVSGKATDENIKKLELYNIRAIFHKPFELNTFTEFLTDYFKNPKKRNAETQIY